MSTVCNVGLIKWFKSDLDNRKQKVQINDTTGEKMILFTVVCYKLVLWAHYYRYMNSICVLKIDEQIIT